jgi:hypothetical protein
MKILNILCAVFLVSLISGCATNKINMTESDLSAFKSGKVASSFFMVNKKVNYHELLYRVLWLETNSTSLDISGLWDPDIELTVVVNDVLLNTGLDAYELFSIVNDNGILAAYKDGLRSDYAQHYSGNHIKMPKVKLPPKAEYLSTYPDYAGFDELRNELVDRGFNYLFEYLSPDIYGDAIGIGVVVVKMPSQLRVIDLINKRVIWLDPDLFTFESYQLGGDLHALEKDNLALLREGVINGMKNRVLNVQYLANEFHIEIDDVSTDMQ